MTPQERLALAAHYLDSDTAFELECAKLDKNEADWAMSEVRPYTELITKLYKLIHPAVSNCQHPDWDEQNEQIYREI